MSTLLIGVLGALLATNQTVALNTVLSNATGISMPIEDPSDPAVAGLRQVMEEDDAAQDEADKWIQDNQQFADKGGGIPKEEMAGRVRDRLARVKKDYLAYLEKYPGNAKAHLAYGSYLYDSKDEESAETEWEISRRLDPRNPAVWNNLANSYGHIGPIKKAFEYYTKAIELSPAQPIYYENLGTCVYLFRKDSREYYSLTEQQVFDKALGLYQKAVELNPTNFELATYVAETYYGIRPQRTEPALAAWTNALNVATSDVEREGVYIHLARVKLLAGRFDEARAHLNSVTNTFYAELKRRVTKSLGEREKSAKNPPLTNGSSGAPNPAEPDPALDIPVRGAKTP